MFYIDKKLIRLYVNKNIKFIYSKYRSLFTTKEVLGKTFLIYNGKKWLRKDIETMYDLSKVVSSFKNLGTRKMSIFKSKKKKSNIQKKKKK